MDPLKPSRNIYKHNRCCVTRYHPNILVYYTKAYCLLRFCIWTNSYYDVVSGVLTTYHYVDAMSTHVSALFGQQLLVGTLLCDLALCEAIYDICFLDRTESMGNSTG